MDAAPPLGMALIMSTEKTILFLQRAFQKERRALTGHDFRRGLLLWLWLLVLFLLADAIYAFSMTGLYVGQWVMILLTWSVGLWVLIRRLRRTFHPEEVALSAQQRIGVPHDRLINALQLAREQHPHASPGLRDLAIELSEICADALDPRKFISRKIVGSSVKFLVATGIVLAIALGMWPGVFKAGWIRLQDPSGDHPPYTRYRFELETWPARVHAGSDIKIDTRVYGPSLPVSAQLRIRYPDGSVHKVDMWPQAIKDETAAVRFQLELENVRESLQVSVDTPKGRSEWFKIPLLPSPIFEQVRGIYTYPAYTGWPEKSERMRHTDLEVIEGTRIRLKAEANMDLSAARLILIPEASGSREENTFDADTQNFKQVESEWEAQESGVYQLRIFAKDGTPGEVDWEGKVTVLPDGPPQVELHQADLDSIIPAGWELPVSATAVDDVAVQEGRLVMQLAERPAVSKSLVPDVARKDPSRMEIETSISLDDLGALVGAELSYFVEVRDNRPPEGQWASTRIARFHVVSLEEYRRVARTRYQAEEVMQEIMSVRRELELLRDDRNALLEKLAELRKALPPGAQPDANQVRELAKLQQRLRVYIDQVGELHQWIQHRLAFDTLYSFEEPYREWLEEISEGLEGQIRDASGLQSEWTPDPSTSPWSDPFDQAEVVFRENTRPYPPEMMQLGEALEQDLEALQKVGELMRQTQRIQELADAQEALAEKLRMLDSQEQSDEAQQQRLRDMGKEQRAMESELQDIRKKLSSLTDELSGTVPELAEKALKLGMSMDQLDIGKDQLQAAREAAQGNSGEAAGDAQTAADKLSTLLGEASDTAGACQNAGGSCNSLSNEQFKSSIQQMLDAMKAMAPGGLPSSLPMGLRLGGAGVGMGGSMSMMGMVGPQYPSRGGNMSGFEMPGRSLGDGPGRAMVGAELPLEGPGVVNPDETLTEIQATPQFQGVPEQYRPLVEAYFRRLVEDRIQE